MLAQLNLQEYFIDELSIVANKDNVSDDPHTNSIDVDFDIKRNSESPRDFMISLMVDVNRSDEAFSVGDYRSFIKLTGFFRFDENVPEDTINGMISQNGLSILYGIARGIIATATATSWRGKFIIPSVNFIDLIRQKTQSTPLSVERVKKSRRNADR